MKLHTLDEIVRGALFARGYPLHWYLQYMYYAKSGLREIGLDTLGSIKSVKLPVTSYKAFMIPCDWVDFIRIGVPTGNDFYEFQATDSFVRHYNKDEGNNKIPWTSPTDSITIPSSLEGANYSTHINDKGEHMGRIFNAAPDYSNTYMVMRERNEVQLDPRFSETEIYVDYITDGVGVDACSAVIPYAYQTIQAYIFWQQKKHGRQYSEQEREIARAEYYHEHKRLRSRLAAENMTIDNIIRSLRKSTNSTIKG